MVRIRFEREGGFAGLQLSAVVDTEQLPATDRDWVERIVHDADLVPPEQSESRVPPLPDQFTYRIEIEAKTGRRVFAMPERQLSPRLKPLVDFMTDVARSKGVAGSSEEQS